MQRAEWRRRVRPTGAWERAGFVWMWVGGMSLRAIARCTGASVTTVYRWIRRWQREGHVLTRTRGCKPRTWNSQRSIVRHTRDGKGCQEVSLCSHNFNQSSVTDSCKYVFLKTQDKVDIETAAIPVSNQPRPGPHSSGVMCRDTLHDDWPSLSDLASPLPLTPMQRTFYSPSPGTAHEPVSVRSHHRLALASFMDYLQLREGASKQLPLMSDYEHKKRCIEESMLALAQWLTASLLCLAAGVPALSYESIHHNSLNEDSQEEALMFAKAAKSVLETHHDLRCSTIFFSEASGALKSFLDGFVSLSVPYGMSVFEVEMEGQDINKTHAHLTKAMTGARQIRRRCWCITMVVLSDDVAFLAALAERSLMMTSSRLIALTRLPAQTFLENEKLRTTFSTMNAVIGIFYEKSKRFTMYYLEPYSNTEDEVTRAAHWSLKEGLVQTSRLPLFYDKFIRFKRRPTLKIATEAFHSRQTQKDGRNTDHTADYFAQGINFNYRYEHIPDGTFGSKQDDGSWSGMIGAVLRKEADFANGPFSLSPSRVEIVDFTSPIIIQYSVILGGRGLPQVDPWAFLFPLGPFVCAAILAALVVVPLIMVLLFTCASFPFPIPARLTWPANLFEMIRVLLLQDNKIPGGGWWWRRLAMGGWMLTALVLIKSYAGNLMSVLTVRYVQQPYQSLSDVVRDPSVSMIWQTNTSNVQFIRSAETGIYRELADAEKNGRTKFQPIMNFFWSLDKLVRRRDHVLIDVEMMIMLMIGHDFTFTGRCDFYKSKEKFLPVMLSVIGQKNSPLVPSLSRRIYSITEAGLYYHWVKTMVPNYTSCASSPTKITVSTTLSVDNLWGMFVVLVGGYVVGLLVLLAEVVAGCFFLNTAA